MRLNSELAWKVLLLLAAADTCAMRGHIQGDQRRGTVHFSATMGY